MNNLKSYLYILLGLLCLVLAQFWFQANTTTNLTNQNTQIQKPKEVVLHANIEQPDANKLATLKNDSMNVVIDLNGGRVLQTQLNNYFETKKQQNNMRILNYGKDFSYYAQSGFVGDELLKFSVNKASSSKDKLVIEAKDGPFVYKKIFSFDDSEFTLKQVNTIENIGVLDQRVVNYLSLISLHNASVGAMESPKQFSPGMLANTSSGWFVLPTYAGVSYHTPDAPYVKLPYSQIAKEPGAIDLNEINWFAVQQRYFLNAWVPKDFGTGQLATRWESKDENGLARFSVSMIGHAQKIVSNQIISSTQLLYSGPELADVLNGIAPGLNLTIDYGWLWLLSELIFKVLKMFDMLFNNWGVAIILTTTFIKLLFYKMSEKGFVASLKMKALQPRIKDIQDRFKDDPMQKNQAIMALYKEEAVNPMGGCLPLLLQFPFLIALYWVLVESVQLRHASFLWIPDLSSYDPFYILPLVMGVGLFFQQKLTPTTMDPAQEQAMMIMPVMMTFIFSQFPAGLALYMLTSSVLSALQQWYLIRKYK